MLIICHDAQIWFYYELEVTMKYPAFCYTRDESHNSFSFFQQDLMLFDIRISEWILACRFVDHLSICIKEPESIQASIIQVVEQVNLADCSSNWLALQRVSWLNTRHARIKLQIKFKSLLIVPHCNELTTIWILIFLVLFYNNVVVR